MAAVPSTGIPGAVEVGDTTFPQWGVIQTPFSVKEATSQAEKTADMKAGYFLWFTSAAAANAQSTETEGQVPNPLTGVDAIGAFFNSLGEASTWIRVAKVLVGGVLLLVGLAHMTGADNAVASAARKVPLPV
jgi:hypothetical protein